MKEIARMRLANNAWMTSRRLPALKLATADNHICPRAASLDSGMEVMRALVSFVLSFYRRVFFLVGNWLIEGGEKTKHRTQVDTNLSLAITALIDPSRRNNETDPLLQNSPVEFSFYQKQVLSAEDETYYDREDKRLHVVFFSGQWGVTPVCNRVNGSKVSKGDMAVSQEGTAAGLGVNTGLLLVMTVLAVMVML